MSHKQTTVYCHNSYPVCKWLMVYFDIYHFLWSSEANLLSIFLLSGFMFETKFAGSYQWLRWHDNYRRTWFIWQSADSRWKYWQFSQYKVSFLLFLLMKYKPLVTIYLSVYFFSRILDLSFNRIRKIEGVSKLEKIEKLYFVQNKISAIENLECLHSMTMLELGANRIRVSWMVFFSNKIILS